MNKILVTGSTGNVGSEVVKELVNKKQTVKSAVFNEKDKNKIKNVESVLFDFSNPGTWELAMKGVDRIFLMRPPAIADVKRLMFPFINFSMKQNVKQIVFLSLQGVQFNFLTPHHKIEKYLKRVNAPYTFLRPNFFMQNLSTFYKKEIKENNEIFLPAGSGKTAFVDVRDIAAVAAKTLTEDGHINKAYDLSGAEALDYYQVSKIMSDVLGTDIIYKNPTFKEYKKHLEALGFENDYIKVQKMLYFVVRHNLSKQTTLDIEKLLHRKPTSFRQFVSDYENAWA